MASIFTGTRGNDEHHGRQLTMYGGDGYDLLQRQGKYDENGVFVPPKPGGVLYGGDGNDFLIAYDGNDRLYGGAGDDHVDGDRAYGGDGNDEIKAGRGYVPAKAADETDPATISRLSGGEGDDTFIFDASLTTARLPDFRNGEDSIELTFTDNTGTGAEYNHHLRYDSDSGTLYLKYRVSANSKHHRKSDAHETVVAAKLHDGTKLDIAHDIHFHVEVVIA